jgi:fructose-specific phosphotransferase system IIC component
MGFVALLALIVALVLLGICLAFGVIAGASLALLLGVGVISTSCLIGLRTRRPSAAVRAFLFQCCGLSGIPIGILCAWALRSFWSQEAWLDGKTALSGAIGGLLAGLFSAWCVDLILKQLQERVTAHLKNTFASPH